MGPARGNPYSEENGQVVASGDFHTHTLHSDGILNPTEVVKRAAANGVRVLAVTDHDTTDGLAEADEAARAAGVRLIAGVELSADGNDGSDYHLLGYFPSVAATLSDSGFQSQLQSYRDGRQLRGRLMLDRLAALEMPLEWDRVLAIAGEAAVSRPHVAQAMIERGYAASVRDAFDRFLHDGGPVAAKREKLPPHGAIKLISAAGGAAVLAHPCFLPEPEAAVAELMQAGLTGVEVYYKNLGPDEVDRFATLATKLRLIASGGSDYHGIHDDEREPGDITFENARVDEFVTGLEAQWRATRKSEQVR